MDDDRAERRRRARRTRGRQGVHDAKRPREKIRPTTSKKPVVVERIRRLWCAELGERAVVCHAGDGRGHPRDRPARAATEREPAPRRALITRRTFALDGADDRLRARQAKLAEEREGGDAVRLREGAGELLRARVGRGGHVRLQPPAEPAIARQEHRGHAARRHGERRQERRYLGDGALRRRPGRTGAQGRGARAPMAAVSARSARYSRTGSTPSPWIAAEVFTCTPESSLASVARSIAMPARARLVGHVQCRAGRGPRRLGELQRPEGASA